MQISIIGMGMGDPHSLTLEARDAIRAAQLIIGSRRMLDIAEPLLSGSSDTSLVEAVTVADTLAALEGSPLRRVCVLCSGDTGFFSLATSLQKTLPSVCAEGAEVQTLCGITTVQYLAARLGRPWQDCALRSAHGTSCDILGEVLAHGSTFFLTGGRITPSVIARTLDDAGLGDASLTVAERLSYPDERIVTASARELRDGNFSTISSVWVERGPLRTPEVEALIPVAGGIPDGAFLRSSTPMTKRAVREVAISELAVGEGQIVFDIGAGTGSVSIELALSSPFVTVYAIENDPDAFELLKRNRVRFGAYNITPIPGLAPDALAGLPAPDAVFIGGSRGRLDSIVDAVLAGNPAARIVASAVTIETLSQVSDMFLRLHEEGAVSDPRIAQVSVSHTHAVGSYHMLEAANPVFIIGVDGTPA